MVLIAHTEETLQRLVDGLNESCGRYGLKFTIGKTEALGVTKRRDQLRVNIRLRGCLLKQVTSFKYLGSLVCEDAKCDNEIRVRIGMAKTTFGQIRKILVSLSINM